MGNKKKNAEFLCNSGAEQSERLKETVKYVGQGVWKENKEQGGLEGNRIGEKVTKGGTHGNHLVSSVFAWKDAFSSS